MPERRGQHAEEAAGLVDGVSSMHKAWIPSPASYKPDMVVDACQLSTCTREMTAERSGAHGIPPLHSEFKASLGYILRLCKIKK